MNKQGNHEPAVSTREFIEATIRILQGELRSIEGVELSQEDLDRIIGELGYVKQQLEKRLTDPGVRCICGTRMEPAGAMGWRCPACGQHSSRN